MPKATACKAKALMIQGTCSNAGKSLLVTAFCRMLSRTGLRTVPFKAQNMSLNSFVTRGGEEMGRAQALQAEACWLEPDVRMNPVLLKPVASKGSQILLLGKPYGTLTSQDFQYFQKDLWQTVKKAYRELVADYDVVILEGAGSPAEINLRRHDIVNMRMARFANADVLLAADIDRGGAFAALLGTMQLLTPRERTLIRGLILNKFRGDQTLLQPALKRLEKMTKRPFFGIVPWIPDLGLPDEDSVSLKQGERFPCAKPAKATQQLDFVLIDLPHLSNATDVDPLLREKNLQLRIVRSAKDLGEPDCLLLPGSRNTGQDLAFLAQTGLDQAIRNYARQALEHGRGMLIGICGGLQMLGTTLDDPLGLEGKRHCQGLGLFPMKTRLTNKKILCRSQGLTTASFGPAGLPVFGYEIHHGESSLENTTLQTLFRDKHGKPLGYGLLDRQGQLRLWGTYLHGIFDSDSFRNALCNSLRRDRGLTEEAVSPYERETALERLADCVEQAIPLQKILALLDLDCH